MLGQDGVKHETAEALPDDISGGQSAVLRWCKSFEAQHVAFKKPADFEQSPPKLSDATVDLSLSVMRIYTVRSTDRYPETLPVTMVVLSTRQQARRPPPRSQPGTEGQEGRGALLQCSLVSTLPGLHTPTGHMVQAGARVSWVC